MYVLQPKSHYRKLFEGSDALFASVWRTYRQLLRHDIDDPTHDSDVMDWLDKLATQKVNDPASRFFIFGR